ncbi:TPA: hypothetical protein RUX58_001742 [Aeromonas dhakensis]|nr:hypothetical protein [Aeromonas dhakensis]
MANHDAEIISVLNEMYGEEFYVDRRERGRLPLYITEDKKFSFEIKADFIGSQEYKEPLNIRLKKILQRKNLNERKHYVIDGNETISLYQQVN